MKEIMIYGKDCKTKQQLFDTFAKALDFPDYFGGNWDSFDEVICDLSWIEEEVIILKIVDITAILEESTEEDSDIFYDILSHVEEYSEKRLLLELITED